jgi:hypothetical protein
MNKKLLLLSSLLVLLMISTTENVLADHGSGSSGGGCSGDCAPPTLGQDNSGRDYVKEGFSINGNSFEVTHFKQEIQTQTIKTGESVEIVLKIYENSGTQYLSHVGLLLGLEEKTLSGVKVNSHQSQIIWEQDLDGTISTDVIDTNNLISNVDVKNELIRDAFGNDDGLNQISFKFTPTKPFDTNTILVEMWDYERNSWTNSFHNSLIIEKAETSDDDISQKSYDPLVPSWVKTNAGFWAENQIDDETFSNGIKFLIKEKIIDIPNLKEFEPQPKLHFIESEKGPQHYIERYYNDEFYREWFDVNYPEYTIEEAVGYTSDLVIPDWVKSNAKLWTNDQISDKEFVTGIAFLIENGIILL